MTAPTVARTQTVAEAVAAKLATAPPFDATTKARLATICQGTAATAVSRTRGRS